MEKKRPVARKVALASASLSAHRHDLCFASVEQSQLLKQRLITSSSNQEAVGLIAQHMVTTCEDR